MLFQEQFRKSFSNFYSTQYYQLILQVIHGAAGVALPNFPSYRIVEQLFRLELQRLPGICTELIANLRLYLKDHLTKICSKMIDAQYFGLIQKLTGLISELSDDAEKRANERVEEILEMEERVFSLNPSYSNGVDTLKQQLDQSNARSESPEPTDQVILLGGNRKYRNSARPSNGSSLNNPKLLIERQIWEQNGKAAA